MKRLLFWHRVVFLLAVFSAVFVSGAYAATLECFDDGSIKITGMAKKWPVSAKEKYGEGDYFEVPGKYYVYKMVKDKPTYIFESDEALLVSQAGGKYSVKFGKYKATAKCPPFRFSCRIFNMSVDYCYTRGNLFTAKFMVYNFHFDPTNVLRFTSPFMLWYEVKTKEGRSLVHASDRYSPDFKEVNISMRKLNAGSKFVFKWGTEEKVERFFIRYNQCRQERYNFYKSADCTEAAACTIERDCFDDENCSGGWCEKLDCEECQYVMNHSCFNYSCCLDEDCSFNEKCEEHACLELNCSFDEEVINHSCAKLECGGEEYVSEHQCLKLECLGWEEAVNHTCQKLECAWHQKAKEHKCVNFLVYYWDKLFKAEENSTLNKAKEDNALDEIS